MESARERMIGILVDIIDPEAFRTFYVNSDKPVDERGRICERQIVARERAGQIIDRLIEENDVTPCFHCGRLPLTTQRGATDEA